MYGEKEVSNEPEDKVVVLKMWKDGFSIDDGDVRRYDDPANQKFLEDIKEGKVPMELVKSVRGAK